MKNNFLFISLLAALFLVSACKSKKLASSSGPADVESMQDYWDANFISDYIEARGKASVTQNGKTTNVAMHLKMKKDSLVWGKFSMFGIGVTVLITPDSFFMVNTLAQEYMAYDNSYLDQFLGFRASVSQVQNLLLGNPIFDQNKYRYNPTNKVLTGLEGYAQNEIIINKKLRTLSSVVRTQNANQSATVLYDEYEEQNNDGLLPTVVSLDVDQPSMSLDVVLNYQNINLNKITKFPFKIPYGFTRR